MFVNIPDLYHAVCLAIPGLAGLYLDTLSSYAGSSELYQQKLKDGMSCSQVHQVVSPYL